MRRCASECDDTSIATTFVPPSASTRRTRCSSTGPGVVSPAPPSTATPALPSSTPSVPMLAVRVPESSSSRCRIMPTVVVLPLVPVTPISCSPVAGLP